ncbi:MAG: PAC2 family protein [bacterium]|nr:PAC2 family protein [bacterium]
MPQLENPVFIAGFDGWGNALNISNGMAAYIIRRLKAKNFADLDPDTFYRYDEQRPVVDIVEGNLNSLKPPSGSFYAVETDADQNDLIILQANEPNLQWFKFVDLLFSICREQRVGTIITLGSMYDNVLHTDRIISAVASSPQMLSTLKQKRINSISYQGPSAIHSIIQSEGTKRGFDCISLWSHCPYYLQGTTHFGILSYLGELIAGMMNFHLDTLDLQDNWKKLEKQINMLIESNSELQTLIGNLRKEKVKGTTVQMKGAAGSDEKIINLQDFLGPK